MNSLTKVYISSNKLQPFVFRFIVRGKKIILFTAARFLELWVRSSYCGVNKLQRWLENAVKAEDRKTAKSVSFLARDGKKTKVAAGLPQRGGGRVWACASGGLGVWLCVCWGEGRLCEGWVEYSRRPCDLHFLSAPHVAAGSVHNWRRQLRKHNTITSHPQGRLKHSCCPSTTLHGLAEQHWTLTYIDATVVEKNPNMHF